MSPNRDEVDAVVPPLTRGERLVVDFLDDHLEYDWEIYVQPFMNGLRPDVVVLNPQVGIGVFEVKDWAAGTLAYHAGRERDDAVLSPMDRAGAANARKRSPLAQVMQYRAEVAELYCPSLGTGNGIATVTGATVFTEMSTDAAQKLLAPDLARLEPKLRRYLPVSGRDRLDSGDLERVFPTGVSSRSQIMTPAVADELRRWLVEPLHARDQRTAIRLDSDQRRLAESRTASGYRRLRGPAGSGKSLVLAARAASLATAGKDVLVVSYNHTLTNYLGDLAVRAGARRTAITWLGFHEWCKRTMRQAGRWEVYQEMARRLATGTDKRRILDTQMATETLERAEARTVR